jgi:hypothetical protein
MVIFQHDAESSTFLEALARVSPKEMLSRDAENDYSSENSGHSEERSLPWLCAEAKAKRGLPAR